MNDKTGGGSEGDAGRAGETTRNGARPVETERTTDSPWQQPDVESFEADDRAVGETLQARTKALAGLTRANELFGTPAGREQALFETFVGELPQWFQYPDAAEARLTVDTDAFETDDFRLVSHPLTADARTRTGTQVRLAVGYADGPPEAGNDPWLADERQLVAELVSIVATSLDRWEVDSLKHFSDGVVILDTDFRYTYVDREAETLLGRESDELRGRRIWEAFPGAAGTVVKERIERAKASQTADRFSRYSPALERWVDVRVYPSGNRTILSFTDITERRATDREVEQILESAPVGILVLSSEGNIRRANARAEEILALPKDELEGMSYDHQGWDVWDEEGDPIAPADHPVSRALQTGETVEGFVHGITHRDGTERWLSTNVAPVASGRGDDGQLIVVLEDITELKRLERLIETLQPVQQILNGARKRQETERDICALLTDTREYDRAWIGEYVPGRSRIEPHAQDPGDGTPPGNVTFPVTDATDPNPVREAIDTGRTQVVGGEQCQAEWQEQLFPGDGSCAIVPLTHEEQTYGVLGLGTARGNAFDEREQTLLTSLGARIGRTIHAIESEQLLHAERVVELTFRSTDPGSLLVRTTDELGCTIDVLDAIPRSAETLVYYASVQGSSIEAVSETLADTDGVDEIRVIRQSENPVGGDVELVIRRRSLAFSLVTAGAVITKDTATDGEAEVVCEMPANRDVESLVTRLTDSYPETTLVAKREQNRSAKALGGNTQQVLANTFQDLTDRQQQVIRAALYGGYFESPRRSSASDIAEALSLTQPTVSYHLRNAQRELFDALLEAP